MHHSRPGLEEVEASLVMQSAVSSAMTEGARVLVVMATPSWSSLPPPWHLMTPVTPDIMKTISFIYPRGIKVIHKMNGSTVNS